NVGGVIGSWDWFRTSLVVGTGRTFLVTAHCQKLGLAVNYLAGRYGDIKGVFELNVMEGIPISLPTRLGAPASVAIPQFGIPAFMQPGSILPQLVFDVGQRSPKPISNKRYRIAPTGTVAYAV